MHPFLGDALNQTASPVSSIQIWCLLSKMFGKVWPFKRKIIWGTLPGEKSIAAVGSCDEWHYMSGKLLFRYAICINCFLSCLTIRFGFFLSMFCFICYHFSPLHEYNSMLFTIILHFKR